MKGAFKPILLFYHVRRVILLRECLLTRLPHSKCIRLGSVVQVTSHLKCIRLVTCVQVPILVHVGSVATPFCLICRILNSVWLFWLLLNFLTLYHESSPVISQLTLSSSILQFYSPRKSWRCERWAVVIWAGSVSHRHRPSAHRRHSEEKTQRRFLAVQESVWRSARAGCCLASTSDIFLLYILFYILHHAYLTTCNL